MPKPTEPAKKDHHSTEKLGYRPQEKKNGAGKGNWGVPTDPEIAPAAIDERDPNYVDPEDEPEKPAEAPKEK